MSVEMGAGTEHPNLQGAMAGVTADGRLLQHSHFLPVRPGARIRVVFEPTSNRRRQAVVLRATVPIQVAGQRIEARPVVLWRHKAPEMVMLIFPEGGELMVRNVWEDRHGTVAAASHQNGPMVVEEVPGGFRYRCTAPDDGGDPLEFRLERDDLSWV